MKSRIYRRIVFFVLSCTVAFVAEADFRIGCDYWASNAGAYMWRRWDAKCVEADLDALKDSGANTLSMRGQSPNKVRNEARW